MSFDYQKVWESKAAYRKVLAALPFVEKLRLLDRMAERALSIRATRPIVPQSKPSGESK